MGGVKEPGKNSSQGPFSLIQVSDDPQVQIEIIQGGVGNQEDLIEELGEDTPGAVYDPLAMDLEEGFILSHAEVFPPRQDNSGGFHLGLGSGFFSFSLGLFLEEVNLFLQGLVLIPQGGYLDIQLGQLAVQGGKVTTHLGPLGLQPFLFRRQVGNIFLQLFIGGR